MVSQPTSSTPSTEPPKEEPEVAAASTAEITHGKSSEQSTDLSDLAAALDSAAQSPSEDAAVTSPEDSAPVAAEPERELSKEEMVEEALNCPCISSMRDGPCGDSFISAYRCFLESETEPKGMDCMDQFTGMQSCMAEHPEEYNLDDDEDDPFAVAEQRAEEGEKTDVGKDESVAEASQTADVSVDKKPQEPAGTSPSSAPVES